MKEMGKQQQRVYSSKGSAIKSASNYLQKTTVALLHLFGSQL